MRLREAARAQLMFSFRKILKPLDQDPAARRHSLSGVPRSHQGRIRGESPCAMAFVATRGRLTRAMLSDYTGVSLADVNRFIDDEALLAPPETTNEAIITEVLHIWSTDPHLPWAIWTAAGAGLRRDLREELKYLGI